MKTRMEKSIRNRVMMFFIQVKSCLKTINMKDKKVKKNNMPADARTSLSFNTGMLYPSTFSPN
jgi:hypothetical protein